MARVTIATIILTVIVLAGCGKEPSGGASSRLVEEKVPPYNYSAPVNGHLKEANIGEFDLPLSSPKVDELSYGDREQKRRLAGDAPKPTEQSVKAAYESLRDAAQKKDFKALLAAMGFDARQSLAIRGLDGIDADFAVFADRFLAPGTPGDPWARPGSGQIRGEGLKASLGKKYWNDYYFDLCGDRLVLTGITEQTQ